ncbi:hypothetical protein [Umezawaea sp. NPDC059074]|uniref:hypothetical protein n=1 Tax=Umezawaea sp. NPDC059074 TaxID=3346716 RepID=UPI0036B6C3D4
MSDTAAIAAYPVLAGVIALRDVGWTFLHRDLIEGVPTTIEGFRLWHGGWIDAVRVRGDGDAMALRTDGTDPPGIVWETSGTLADVIDALRVLPSPDHPLAPRLVRATGPIPTPWTGAAG